MSDADIFNPRQFFETAIANGRLAHAYILQGHNTAELYDTALYVAQIVNCESTQPPCHTCTSCRWTLQNAHPAILTVSRITYLTTDEGEDLTPEQSAKLLKSSPPKLIKTGQIQRLIHQLNLSSPYARVVIFTDLEEIPAGAVQAGMTKPPSEWVSLPGNEEKRLALKPLHQGIFNVNSVNRFLKTLEEPPPRTLIFYLTDNTGNLLDTIVSRCQVIPFPMQAETPEPVAYAPEDAAFLSGLFIDMTTTADFYPCVDRFITHFVQNQGLTETQAIGILQAYLRNTALQDHKLTTGEPFYTYRHHQRLLEEAHQRLAAKTNTAQTLHHLFWQWSAQPA